MHDGYSYTRCSSCKCIVWFGAADLLDTALRPVPPMNDPGQLNPNEHRRLGWFAVQVLG
jgi:hypothetical protein